MSLLRLEIHHLRNISSAALDLSPRCNLITGANASGKTSLLEAIHILALARSFRTTHIRHVIQRGETALQVFGRRRRHDGQIIPLGIERSVDEVRIRIAGQSVQQVSELATLLPLQLLNPESHQILEQGPRFRRQYLDWGVFHVEHGFLAHWRQFQRALRQRNAVLRQSGSGDTAVWDKPVLEHGQAVQAARARFLDLLKPRLDYYAERLLGFELDFQLQPGWPADKDYSQVLTRQLEQDREAGFTRQGPHRADLLIKHNGIAVQSAFSRGQQKLLVAAMRLAQVDLLSQQQSEPCLLLVDDLPAELDARHRAVLLGLLRESGAQLFVTSTEPELLSGQLGDEEKMFHVEHGLVREVV